MKILAIETSCDETAIALMETSGALEKPDIKVLGNTLLSQVKLHEKYGGVYPTLAKREHQKNLPILLEKVFLEPSTKNLEPSSIDFIAVTSGPGLEPALWTGITFAEELGKKWNKPVIPVNHMAGHIFSVLFPTHSNVLENIRIELPAMALLVSGGHTELVLIKDFGEYEILGQTRDDAAGEAFDKVARMLGLPYPGGPEISKLAEMSRGKRNNSVREFPDADREQTELFRFPRPMINSKDLDFSFSGLKTAVLYKLKSLEAGKLESIKGEMAREFEDAVVEVLVEKTRKAIMGYGNEIKTLIVAGGVSANNHLRQEIEKMAQTFNLETKFPSLELAGDNALMIGLAGFIKVKKAPEILQNKTPIIARGNLRLS